MPDFIGSIEVPFVPFSGATFPITPDRQFGIVEEPRVSILQFGSGNQKIEQRYTLGPNARRFVIRKAKLSEPDRIALLNFFEARKGKHQAFLFNVPRANESGVDGVTVRFADETLAWQQVGNLIASTGVTLVEQPSISYDYSITSTLSRFADASLATALLGQAQEVIPLVRITFKDPAYNSGAPIYVSDRRCTVGGQLYLPRLTAFGGISQSLDGQGDQAEFAFGNADGVMSALVAATDLWRAEISFSLFHVLTITSGVKVDLWGGEVSEFSGEESADLRVIVGDGMDLQRDHPRRKIDRACANDFNNGTSCPYASVGTPGFTSCDKAFTSCQARGMANYFAGILVMPEGVNLRAKGGFGITSQNITRTSQVNDSIMGRPLQEIYTDSDMPVNCDIATGREENEFYAALGIVGAGPISAFASDGNKHRLDGQTAHGPLPLGLERSFGAAPSLANNPETNSNVFSIDSSSPNRSAGVARLLMRRTDPKGMQLSRIQDHQMQAWVAGGLSGHVWSGGTRSVQASLTNPVWIAINTLFRSLDIQGGSAALQASYFDVPAAEAAAALCATTVATYVGTAGTEPQFKYRGIVGSEVRPVRDWLADILQNCLGYFTFANRKLKVGIRIDASAVEAFTAGNILVNSLRLQRFDSTANEITATFADDEFNFQSNTIRYEDELHRKTYGRRTNTMNLTGTAGKSQAARIIATRTREECGGISLAEYRNARRIAFKTSILALNVEPGMVCSMTDARMPGGSGKFRVTSWRLNPDYSIDIEGRTVTNSMYDLTTGPKPADVAAAPVPGETVTDLVPGDVVAIGANAFTLTQSVIVDSDAKQSIALDVTFDPPAPIGTFAGVNGWLRRLADGVVFDLGLQNHNGNGTVTAPGRYGTCRFVVPPPGAVTETWEIYLTSWSQTIQKKLVVAGGAGAVAPYRTITASPVTPVGGAPAENVASVTATPNYDGANWGVSGVVTFGANRATIRQGELVIIGPYTTGGAVIAGVTIERPWTTFAIPVSGTYSYSVEPSWLRFGNNQQFKVACRVYSLDNIDTATPTESPLFTVTAVNQTTQASSVSAGALYNFGADGVVTYKIQLFWTNANDSDFEMTRIYLEAEISAGVYALRQLYSETGPNGIGAGFAQSYPGTTIDNAPSVGSTIYFRMSFVTVATNGDERPSPPTVIVSVSDPGPQLAGSRLVSQSVGTSKIALQAIDDARIAVNGLNGGKVQANTIPSAAIIDLVASKIQAGTITAAVSMTSPSLTVTSGSVTINIDGSNYIRVQDTAQTRFTRMNGTSIRVEKTTDNFNFTDMVLGSVVVSGPSGTNQASLLSNRLQFQGIDVVGPRLSSVASPSGGGVIDVEARLVIDTIRSRLQTHGLIS